MRRQLLTYLTLAGLLGGCHSYHSAGTAVPSDARIRVQFSPLRSVVMRAPNGTMTSLEVWEITGRLLAMRGDTIVMRPSKVRVKDEFDARTATDAELVIVRGAGTRVGEYRADAVKTTLLTTAIAATVLVGGFYALLAAAMMSSD